MNVRTHALVIGLALAACSKSEPTSQTQAPASAPATSTSRRKDPELARKLIAEGAAVIDVRSPDEFASGHVPTATNIPVDQVASRIADVESLVHHDKTKPVVVYCGTGNRAGKAKAQLETAGFTQVVNGGGLDDLE